MKKLFGLILLLVSINAWSGMIIETIPLSHRTAEDILSAIEPMLDEDGSLTAHGYNLIIKSTPANIKQIRTLIKDIDINPKQLRVSVSYLDQSHQNDTARSVAINTTNQNGQIELIDPKQQDSGKLSVGNDKIKSTRRIYQTQSKRTKNSVQVMTIVEGYWGSISMGQAIPITTRSRNPDGTVTVSVRYDRIMTGFRIKPHTNGDNVTLTIQQQRQSPNQDTTTFDSSEIKSVVSGKLGQWLFIGGTDHSENLNQSGLTYRTRVRSTNVNQLWVKVERPY